MYCQNSEQKERLKNLKSSIGNDFFVDFFKKTPVRIALITGLVVVTIYAGGKFLRLLGGAVKDGKYFIDAIKE